MPRFIETQRLRLRPSQASDAAGTTAIYGAPSGSRRPTPLAHLPQGRYQVYRIRHGDLDYHD